jgi:hypothetical protein
MDNTTNNDTLVQSLGVHFTTAGIPFSATDACMRCIPHIIHLAALQLLEGIGAISATEKRQVYQDIVSDNRKRGEGAEVSEEDDGEGGGNDVEADEDASLAGGPTAVLGNLSVVTKVRLSWLCVFDIH